MKTHHHWWLFLMLFLLAGCAAQTSPVATAPAPTATSPIHSPLTEASSETELSPAETAAPDCLGGERSPIAQSIAEDYPSTGYEQVMTLFCNGAEFEDILVALETQAQTDQPAGEILKMLAEGQTWDEIWQALDLTD